MVDNVQIVNKNGDGMYTEGISYIEILTSGKKYLFYTLNEKVDNDLTKIYIAQTCDAPGEAQPISDDEWNELRKKMVKISHKEPLEDVKFLSMANVVFNVGEPKKLAVTAVAKQSFRDAQISNTLSTNTSDESVMSSGNTAFYNDAVVGPITDNTQVPEAEQTASIFANPPQPIITEETDISTAPAIENAAPVQEASAQVVDQAPVSQPVTIETPVVEATPVVQPVTIETPVVDATPVVQPVTIETPVVEATPVVQPVTIETPVVDATPVVQPVTIETPVVEAVPVVQPVTIETPAVESDADLNASNNSDEVIITDEEALAAINLIQEYIDQESNK